MVLLQGFSFSSISRLLFFFVYYLSVYHSCIRHNFQQKIFFSISLSLLKRWLRQTFIILVFLSLLCRYLSVYHSCFKRGIQKFSSSFFSNIFFSIYFLSLLKRWLRQTFIILLFLSLLFHACSFSFSLSLIYPYNILA